MDFIDDDEKMRDFFKLTKDEFLSSYSYLKEKDYDETKKIVDKSEILELIYEGKDSWERPVYKSKRGERYKDVALGDGNNLRKSLYTSVANSFDGEPSIPLNDNVIPKVLHYIPIKELTGNEDLKKICKKIKFYEDDLLPEDTKRKQLIEEIKKEIEWQLDMVSPNVDKETLMRCHNEILQIEKDDADKEYGTEIRYKGFIALVGDYNDMTDQESIVEIYKSEKDFEEDIVTDTVSLLNRNLRKNIEEYIDASYTENEVKITRLSILKDLKKNIEHNILCYSANYLMTQPKEQYVNEWKAENKKLLIVEDMIKDEKQKKKEKNNDKSL